MTPKRPQPRRFGRRKRRPKHDPDERARLIREHIEKHGVTRVPSAYSRVD